MKKVSLTLLLSLFILTFSHAQDETLEELKSLKAEKEAVKAGIDGEIAEIAKRIKEFPGWNINFAGQVGLNFSGTNDWFANEIETNSTRGFNIGINAFANQRQPKYFWNNSLVASFSRANSSNRDIDDATGVEQPEEEVTSRASYFELASLGGYRFVEQFAISAEARYSTTIDEFNDPGKLTLSAGATWTPISNLVVIIHPLGFQWTFPGSDFSSAAGAKLGAVYNGNIMEKIGWTSDFNAFIAYGGDDEADLTAGELSNWTWFNSFTIADIFKGIGVGTNIGLRRDQQLAFGKGVEDGGGIQFLYTVGISYALSRSSR